MMHLVKRVFGDEQLLLCFMEDELDCFILGGQLASCRVEVRCETLTLTLQRRDLLLVRDYFLFQLRRTQFE